LFQKAFVADNLAKIVDPIFADPPTNGAIVLIGLYAYAFQIYGDFAGYSNMARGLAKLMGFELMINFRTPYFATNPKEFWQRWHISLSTWLRDYLYIPLGGNRAGEIRTYANLFLTMLLGGLWHGAAWHFVCWGMFHGALLMMYHAYERNTLPLPKWRLEGNVWKIIRIVIFFHLTCFGWLLFRSPHIPQAFQMAGLIFTHFQWPDQADELLGFLFFMLPLLLFELAEYHADNPFSVLRWQPVWQGMVYFFIYYCLMIYGIQGGQEFVYFQF